MKKLLFILAAGGVLTAEGPYLTGLHQLTHGGQNAEAYWSPDGKRLIFQSTRKPYDCDQEFIMNADGSDQHLVSTGKGRTTCGYFLADNRHIIYASTHLAGDACPTPPDHSKGYVWGVFPGYDIFLATDDGKIEKRLTDAPGYDAEGTINWKTGTVVYTSLASGDLDLWSMRTDGSGKKQLTKAAGYDGGPVLSRDGKKILFSSNQHDCDSRRFELYLMNLDGTGLEQVSHFGGFTSFPEFSPDGQTLVFCSDKDAKDRYEFNIFTARWQ